MQNEFKQNIDGENIIVPCVIEFTHGYDLSIYIYQKKSGKLVRNVDVKNIPLNEFFAYNGKMYLINYEENLIIIDYVQNKREEIKLNLSKYDITSIIGLKNSLIFVGTKELFLYSIQEKKITGNYNDVSGSIMGNPTIINNIVYFGTYNGLVYALEGE